MRRRILLKENTNVIDGSKAKVLDVVFFNKDTESLEIISSNEIVWDSGDSPSHPKAIYTPIGIVVIPGEHGVLKNGAGTKNQCGIMGLFRDSSYYGIDNRSISAYFGGYNVTIQGKSDNLKRYDSYIENGFTLYHHIILDDGNIDSIDVFQTTVYAPRQDVVGGNAITTKTPAIPSPYSDNITKNSGEYNELYGSTSKDTNSQHNVLADFRGIVNTKILTDLATGQEDWKTSETITSSYEPNYYPAACRCARFCPIGTKAFIDCTNEELHEGSGFWYMPAFGELCYVISRYSDINDLINKIKNAYKVHAWDFPNMNLNTFISSTSWSNGTVWGINTQSGGVSGYYYNNKSYNVIPFMRL